MQVKPLLFSVKETAAWLTKITGKTVNIQRVYYLIRMARLAAFRIGRHIRVFLNLSALSAV